MSKVIVIAGFKPKDGLEAQARAVIETMIAPTRKEPGNLIYDFFKEKEGNGFVLYEVYTDADALAAHRAADYFKNYRAQIMDLLAEPIAVKVLDALDVVGG